MSKPVIMCIDDDLTILNSLEVEIRHVIKDNYLIELAENGMEALEICEELMTEGHDIALVISDSLMPNMRGDEVLKRIHLLSPDTLKVMLTGQADLDSIRKAVQYANLYRYLSKPWQTDDLKLTIQEALQSYHQTKLLAKHTEELECTNQVLRQLNQEKDEFLGIAAHDLKNPLSAIQGWAEMILSDYDQMDKKEVLEVTHHILASSHQMFELIRNLLDVHQIESGQSKIKLSPVDILPIIQMLITCHTRWAKAKHIHLQLQHQDLIYPVLADRHKLHQILDNLISNAIKYSPHHSLIQLKLSRENHWVCCAIKDEGPGLSDLDQQCLFQKFTRLTPKPTGKEHSTGLGLFIVKKLVESMNGKVWCNSQLRKGSTFFIEFPQAT